MATDREPVCSNEDKAIRDSVQQLVQGIRADMQVTPYIVVICHWSTGIIRQRMSSSKTSFKLGHFNAVIISNFDVAKEVLQRDALADRPQLYFHNFFMKFKNIGKHTYSTFLKEKANDSDQVVLCCVVLCRAGALKRERLEGTAQVYTATPA